MRNNRCGLAVSLAGLLILLTLWTPCPRFLVNAQPALQYSGIQVQRIGLVPFFKGRHGSTLAETLTCSICQLDLDPEGVSPLADRVLTEYTQETLKLYYGDKVIPLEAVREASGGLKMDELKDTPQAIGQALGRALQADVMVLGTVWRYRDRLGGAAAATRPASVAFAVYFIDVETGKTLWTERFVETQQSLSENVLRAKEFFKRGGRWLSASELAKYGLEKIFKTLPY